MESEQPGADCVRSFPALEMESMWRITSCWPVIQQPHMLKQPERGERRHTTLHCTALLCTALHGSVVTDRANSHAYTLHCTAVLCKSRQRYSLAHALQWAAWVCWDRQVNSLAHTLHCTALLCLNRQVNSLAHTLPYSSALLDKADEQACPGCTALRSQERELSSTHI